MPTNNIKCPNCGTEVDVQNVLSADLEQKLRQQFEKQWQLSLNQVSADKKSWRKIKKPLRKKRKTKMRFFIKSYNRKNRELSLKFNNSYAKAFLLITKTNSAC